MSAYRVSAYGIRLRSINLRAARTCPVKRPTLTRAQMLPIVRQFLLNPTRDNPGRFPEEDYNYLADLHFDYVDMQHSVLA